MAAAASRPTTLKHPELAFLRTAQSGWASFPLVQRLQVLREFRHLLTREAKTLAGFVSPHLSRSEADTLSAEILPLAEAVRFLETNARAILSPKRMSRKGRPLWLRGVDVSVQHDPWGVVLVIGPANYPIFLPGVQAAQALTAGNAVVWKPGLGSLRVARAVAGLFARAGLPDGLLHVTDESVEAAQDCIRSGVDKIVMTGSAATGRAVLKAAAEHLIPATVELSGCDAMFILASADISRSVDALLFGLRLNGSATCIAPRRVFIDARVEVAFKTALHARLSQAVPMAVSPHSLTTVRRLVHGALEAGAHFVGEEPRLESPLAPVILDGVSPTMDAMRTDVFAPIASLCRFTAESEALAMAEACPYALGSTVFGNPAVAAAFAARVRAGIVVVNDMIVPTADPRIAFGGRAASGFGKSRGAEGLLDMTVSKTLAVQSAKRLRHLEAPHPQASELFQGFLQGVHGRGLGYRLRSIAAIARAVRGKTGQQIS